MIDIGFAAYSGYQLGKAIFSGNKEQIKQESINFGLDLGGALIPGAVGLGTTRRALNAGEEVAKTLYHYTDAKGLKGIVKSGEINPSLKAVNPNDAFHGEGQYLSDIQPGSKTDAQLSRKFINNPFRGDKFSRFVEIDVSDLNIKKGRDGVYLNPSKKPLKVKHRIKRIGRNRE